MVHSGTTWDVSNLLQGCKWCNKTPPLCDRYPGFFWTREDKSSRCFKPFHHIAHFSRQHFRTVLPMWPASLVVILWRIDWNPSRLGCNAQQKSGEIRRVESEASESEVEKHCSTKCHCVSHLFSHQPMWWLGIASHRSMCFCLRRSLHVVFFGSPHIIYSAFQSKWSISMTFVGGGALVLRNAHVVVLSPRYGLQYILASKGVDGTTKKMKLHSDCLGNGEDPLAKTFQQVRGMLLSKIMCCKGMGHYELCLCEVVQEWL